jgi:hypothetical protein
MKHAEAALALAAVRDAKRELAAADLASLGIAHQRLVAIEIPLRAALTSPIAIPERPFWDQLRNELKGLQVLLENGLAACETALEAAPPRSCSSGCPPTTLTYLG